MTEDKIGQILISNRDTVVERAISGEKVIIPKGNRIIIGADKLAHHRDGTMQPLGDAEVKGYDTKGLASYLLTSLKDHFPINEMLEGYDIDEKELLDEIEYALEDIGM